MSKIEMNQLSLDKFKHYVLNNMECARLSPSGRELMFRCPICGDSMSNKRKTSFSINVDPDSDHFLFYQCFRASCGSKGVVNQEFLELLNYSDSDSSKDLINYVIARSNKLGTKYAMKRKRELQNIISVRDKDSEIKLKYINKRLGLNLSFEDLLKLKINLNFKNLLSVNEIIIPERNREYFDVLSYCGICFISAYNDYAIIRDMTSSLISGKRYSNINIFNNYDNVTKCYCIPTVIDLLSPEPTVINISEGAFDIISVYHNLSIDRSYKNQLYLAACGSGIVNTIKKYIQEYGLLNPKINIFSDADVPLEKYNELKKLKPYITKFDVTVYYNIKSKDFGVSKDKIEYERTRL